MESPRNLNEFRNERIESIKTTVFEVAQDHVLRRTDDDYDVVLSKADINCVELCIMPVASKEFITSAPKNVLNEIAIDIATVLHSREDLPYTVDLSSIQDDAPHIRIVKI